MKGTIRINMPRLRVDKSEVVFGRLDPGSRDRAQFPKTTLVTRDGVEGVPLRSEVFCSACLGMACFKPERAHPDSRDRGRSKRAATIFCVCAVAFHLKASSSKQMLAKLSLLMQASQSRGLLYPFFKLVFPCCAGFVF